MEPLFSRTMGERQDRPGALDPLASVNPTGRPVALACVRATDATDDGQW